MKLNHWSKYAFLLCFLFINSFCKHSPKKAETITIFGHNYEIFEPSQPQSWEYTKGLVDERLSNCSDDWCVVNTLREFVASTVDFGPDSLDLNRESEWWKYDLSKLYDIFEHDKRSADFGTSAIMLQKLYKEYAINSNIYIIGLGPKPAHVLNLVPVNYEGEDILTVQDAFYNYTIIDKNGAPKDFLSIIKEIKKNDLSDIFLKPSSFNPPKQYLFKPNAIPDRFENFDIKDVQESLNENYPLKALFSNKVKKRFKEKEAFDSDVEYANLYNMLAPPNLPGELDTLFDPELNIHFGVHVHRARVPRPFNDAIARLDTIIAKSAYKKGENDDKILEILMDHTAATLPWGNVIDSATYQTYQDVEQIYDLAVNHKIAVACMENADYFVKLASCFGFETISYFNCGDTTEGSMVGHALVLVDATFDGKTKSLLIDPYHNALLRNKHGEPKDYWEARQELSQHDHTDVFMVEGSYRFGGRQSFSLDDNWPDYAIQNLQEKYGPERFYNAVAYTNNPKYPIVVLQKDILNQWLQMDGPSGGIDHLNTIERYGYPRNIVYLYLMNVELSDAKHRAIFERISS